MGFGGPVWHASARLYRPAGSSVSAQELASRALDGVGDASLGEWHEQGHNDVFHIRRRLSKSEQKERGLTMIDIRGTPDEGARYAVVYRELSYLRAMQP